MSPKARVRRPACGSPQDGSSTKKLQPMPNCITLPGNLTGVRALNAFTLPSPLMLCRFLKGLLP